MKCKWIFCSITVLLILFDKSKAFGEFKVLIQKAKLVQVNSTTCREHILKITPQRYKSAMISISCYVDPPVNKLWVSVELFYKFKTYQPFMIKASHELCELSSSNPLTHPLAATVKSLLKDSNLLHPCPYQGRTGVSNYTFDSTFFPGVPTGKYRLDVIGAYDSGGILFNLQVFIEIKAIGATDLSFG